MNFQPTTVQIFTLVVLWLTFGAAFDILQTLLGYLSIYISYVPRKIGTASTQVKRFSKVRGNVDEKIIKEFINDLENGFNNAKTSLVAWADNFLQQVVDINPETTDITEDSYRKTNEIMGLSGLEILKNPKAGQRIIGALLEMIALVIFIYADAALTSQTIGLILGKTENLWTPLNMFTVPEIIASAGSAFILGVLLGDILGFTDLGIFSGLKGFKKIIFTTIISLNLIVVIIVAALIALYRVPLFLAWEPSQHFNSPLILGAYFAQSLVVVPLLITTALLFHGVSGIFVFLSLLFRMVAVPFGWFGYLTKILYKLIVVGAISAEYVFAKIVWLVSFAFELIFDILEKSLLGGFLVLISLTALISYVPYRLINAPFEYFFHQGVTGKLNDQITNIHLPKPVEEPKIYDQK